MKEYFYNFITAGKNRGYYYLRMDSEHLFSYTRFLLDEISLFTNVFSLKLHGIKVIACKHGDLDWVDMSDLPADYYPSCAYPLLLPSVRSKPLPYFQVSEDDGSVVAEVTLQREQNDIVEVCNGVTRRRFTMAQQTPIRIDWGGAVSYQCESADDCVEGTRLSFEIE